MMLSILLISLATSAPAPPCGAHAMAPTLCPDGNGAWLSWLEPAPVYDTATSDDVWRLQASRYDAKANTWSPVRTITQRQDFFINWADVPQIGVAGDGSLIATWLQKSGPGTYAYDIGVARSRDGGQHWAMLGTLNDDRTETEHGFVSLVPEGEGMRAVWLDGRAMTAEGHGDDGHGHGAGGAMSLRTSLITNTIANSSQLDDRACECCPTAMIAMPSGTLVAYRDRGDDERRDIALARRSGDDWIPAYDLHRDDWVIAGCPVNGPALDARHDAVVAAWYTGGEHAGVHAAFSTDGGETFMPPTVVAGDTALGRVDVAWVSASAAVVMWIDSDSDKAVLMSRLISPNQDPGAATVVSPVQTGRRSGYPRVCSTGGSTLAVWTAQDPKQGLQATLLAE
jgi:hypothetical protein